MNNLKYGEIRKKTRKQGCCLLPSRVLFFSFCPMGGCVVGGRKGYFYNSAAIMGMLLGDEPSEA